MGDREYFNVAVLIILNKQILYGNKLEHIQKYFNLFKDLLAKMFVSYYFTSYIE